MLWYVLKCWHFQVSDVQVTSGFGLPQFYVVRCNVMGRKKPDVFGARHLSCSDVSVSAILSISIPASASKSMPSVRR